MNTLPSSYASNEDQKKQATTWFSTLQQNFCQQFESLEDEFCQKHGGIPGRFIQTKWQREQGGGGNMAVMNGTLFEKIGVNFSCVYGQLSPTFRREIAGTEDNPHFWASGISVVAHPKSPFVPIVHMNTRHIVTGTTWFGGGADLTPVFAYAEDTSFFHQSLQQTCDQYHPEYYSKFKDWCDRYFYLPHRKEARGVGGIFYDQLNSGNWQNDFAFTQDVGRTFIKAYSTIVRRRMEQHWTDLERSMQLRKRGRYVEFNLLYDRGTRFGIMTDGNTDAILMSLPPLAQW